MGERSRGAPHPSDSLLVSQAITMLRVIHLQDGDADRYDLAAIQRARHRLTLVLRRHGWAKKARQA